MNPASLTHKEFSAPLHGLRGIAVLYVVVSHLGYAGLFLLPIAHYGIGKIGVWIFFSLSAFLLTTHLYRNLHYTPSKISAILEYSIHRVFRIYPLYVLVLFTHAILGEITNVEFFKHLLLIQGKGELWAIPVEFQYYLIIPVIVISAFYIPKKNVSLFLVATIFAPLYYGIMHPESVFSNELIIFSKLTPFILGSALALLLYKNMSPSMNDTLSANFLIPIVCLVGLIAVTVIYRSVDIGTLPNSYAPWLSIAIGGMVVAFINLALQPNNIAKFLRARPLVFFGEISFSIYLLHIFVIRFVTTYFSGLPDIIKAWLSLGLCILLSFVSYRVIESPGIRVGKIIGLKFRAMSS